MPLKNRTHHLKASCFLRGAVSRANCLRSRPERRRAMNELAAAAAAAAKSIQSCPTLCDPIDPKPGTCCHTLNNFIGLLIRLSFLQLGIPSSFFSYFSTDLT